MTADSDRTGRESAMTTELTTTPAREPAQQAVRIRAHHRSVRHIADAQQARREGRLPVIDDPAR